MVLVNSSPERGDPADLVAQMLTQELLNMQSHINLVKYALKIADTSRRLWPALVEEWVSKRVQDTKYNRIEDYVESFTNSAYNLIVKGIC